jgi:hypothetical protein
MAASISADTAPPAAKSASHTDEIHFDGSLHTTTGHINDPYARIAANKDV